MIIKNQSILRCFVVLLFLGLLSCSSSVEEEKGDPGLPSQVLVSELQVILDSFNLEGAILIYDKQKDTYYSNSFEESKVEYLPASTFKIPNSIIGLELGILEDEHTVFKWDGSGRFLPVWEQDLTLKEAFQTSCVPCYQELARKIGVDRMKAYVERLNFGKMYPTQESIDNFWLLGPSKISPFAQIDFLKRLDEGKLTVSKSTTQTI